MKKDEKTIFSQHLFILKRLGVILVFAYLLAGCASFSGYPDRAVSQNQLIQDATPLLNRVKIEECMDSETVVCRNKIISTGILVVDTNFSLFEKALFKEGRGSSFLATVSTLGLTAAGAVNPSATLSAISGGIIGAKAAFDREVLFDQAVLAIHTQMRAERNKVVLRLRNGMREKIEVYPLGIALADLEVYYEAGTLLSAFIGIAESAGVESKAAEVALQKELSFALLDSAGSRFEQAICRGEANCPNPDVTKFPEIKSCWPKANVPTNTLMIDFILQEKFAEQRAMVAICMGL